MDDLERIWRNPEVVGGEPVFKGTRVTLRTVLASLAEGATTAEILADFPTLRDEDVWAVALLSQMGHVADTDALEDSRRV